MSLKKKILQNVKVERYMFCFVRLVTKLNIWDIPSTLTKTLAMFKHMDLLNILNGLLPCFLNITKIQNLIR